METPRSLQAILKQKPDCVFVSPHPDDAVFSAGALISLLAAETKVRIINVFTKPGPTPYTISAKAFLKTCGIEDAEELFEKRVKEDRLVCRKLGVRPLYLDFTDALWRKKRETSTVTELVGSLVPEAKMVYPTYRFHILKGEISQEDRFVAARVEEELVKRIKKDALVFCPLGVGKHVDHLIVREACTRAFQNLVYWSDVPYNKAGLPDEECLEKNCTKPFLVRDNLKKKWELAKNYKSQRKAIPANGGTKPIPEIFYPRKKKGKR